MNDFQEPQPTSESMSRRGMQLVLPNSKLIETTLGNLKTQPVPLASLGMANVFLERHSKDNYPDNMQGFTLDRTGQIIRKPTSELYKDGYYEASIFVETPVTGNAEESSLDSGFNINLWIKDGPILRTDFSRHDSTKDNEDTLVATFYKDDAFLYLPPDIDLLKNIRVSIDAVQEVKQDE